MYCLLDIGNTYFSKVLSLVILILLTFSACNSSEKQPLDNPAQIEKYFPLGGFIEEQIMLLDGLEVIKEIGINGKKETVKLTLDSEAWREELDVFIQADINKNSLATSYETEKGPTFLRHTLKAGEKGDITSLTVQLADGVVRSVAFTFEKENLFYSSKGSGSITMSDAGDFLSGYEVNGRQKVWFLPANVMSTSAKVTSSDF